MNKFIFIAFVLPLAGCRTVPAPAPSAPVVSDLRTAVLQQAQVSDGVRSTGTVRAKEDSVLSAQTTGRVTAVMVREGDAVRAGQTLLTLDNAQAVSNVVQAKASEGSYQQELKVAESDSELAASTLQRYQLLRDRKSVSPQEYEEVERRAQAAKARVDAAKAQLDSAKANVTGTGTAASYARVTAPFDGFVIARHVDPGAMALPGTPLIEVERAGTLQLQVAVDESLVHGLQKGMTVPVSVSALASPLITGRISEIDSAGDPASHSFLIKIDLPFNPALHSGMFGTASLSKSGHAAVLVPTTAIVTHGSLNTVWIVGPDNIASLRYLTLGGVHEGSTEVLSGVTSGERVVLSPEDRELGGRKIEVSR